MVIRGPYISKRKGAKKGTKKKAVDTFTRKEWFDLSVPAPFIQIVGKTLATRATQRQNVDKLLLGRQFECNQADLCPDDQKSHHKFKFIITGVKNRVAISAFNGFELTVDKARGVIKKWHTLVEGHVLVKTTDDFLLRVFVMGMSRRLKADTKARVYIQSTKVKKLRAMMFEVVKEEFEGDDVAGLIKKLMGEVVGKSIELKSEDIFPMMNCFVKKVMVVKRPKVEEVEEVREEEEGEKEEKEVGEGEEVNWE